MYKNEPCLDQRVVAAFRIVSKAGVKYYNVWLTLDIRRLLGFDPLAGGTRPVIGSPSLLPFLFALLAAAAGLLFGSFCRQHRC